MFVYFNFEYFVDSRYQYSDWCIVGKAVLHFVDYIFMIENFFCYNETFEFHEVSWCCPYFSVIGSFPVSCLIWSGSDPSNTQRLILIKNSLKFKNHPRSSINTYVPFTISVIKLWTFRGLKAGHYFSLQLQMYFQLML